MPGAHYDHENIQVYDRGTSKNFWNQTQDKMLYFSFKIQPQLF